MSHWDTVSGLKLDMSQIDLKGDIESLLESLDWEEVQRIDKALKAIQEHYTARERVISSVVQVLNVLIKTGAAVI